MTTGADAICSTLEALGVECVVGVPGTQNVPLYEALRRSGLRSVLTTHELAATFLANGYYRSSGKLAAVVTIPGPGFTYAMTGLAEALHDSAALLHLVGPPPAQRRAFEFQAIDHRGIAAHVAKGSRRIEEASEVGSVLTEAFSLARSGEPGPVVVEWTAAAIEGEVPRATRAATASASRDTAAPRDDAVAIADAVALVAASRRLLILAGQGCAAAAGPLRSVAERLGCPVLTTTSGRGVLPEDHSLALGFELARGDLRDVNALVETCDCVLVIGCKLTSAMTGDGALKLPPDRLIRVDTADAVLAANYAVRLGVRAAAETFLPALLSALPERPGASWPAGEVAQWRTRLRSPSTEPEPIFHTVNQRTPAAFFSALRRALPRDGIVVTDSGLHQTLVRRYLDVLAPRGLLLPSDFQSMGFGLPAALGAKLANPGTPVVAVIGDGGFLMSGWEVLTAIRERISVTVVILNDGYLNRIRLQQLDRYGAEESVRILNPDLESLAASMGAEFMSAEGDLEATLRAAMHRDGVTLVDVAVSDSFAIQARRVRAVAKRSAHRMLGAAAAQWMKRLLDRTRA